jgi:hypothetical protein
MCEFTRCVLAGCAVVPFVPGERLLELPVCHLGLVRRQRHLLPVVRRQRKRRLHPPAKTRL